MPSEPLRIGVVTGERAPDLSADGRAVVATFRERGYAAEPLVWSDDSTDLQRFDVALLRSCWDYHTAPDAFRDWLDAVEAAGATVRNPPSLVRWNLHKRYLLDLAAAGLPVLPTAHVPASTDADLSAVLRDRGWTEAVVKPAIATTSAGAWRTSLADAETDQRRFADALADGDLLVQQFAPEINDGERSLVFLGGAFSHAKRIRPAEGDFRTHSNYGGSSTPYDPAPETVETAAECLRTARDLHDLDPEAVPYARVDGVVRDGEFHLMELELVEPYLDLGVPDDGYVAFVDAVEAALEN